MNTSNLLICRETAEFSDEIENLNAEAFGPGRFTRAAYRLREQAPHCPKLSFMAMIEDGGGERALAGSVRLTHIRIAQSPALLLGPLVVAPSAKNLGIGRELMIRSLAAVRSAGHSLVILVGDLSYYAKFGFKRAPQGRVLLPGPVDPARLLYCELQSGAFDRVEGMARSVAPADDA